MIFQGFCVIINMVIAMENPSCECDIIALKDKIKELESLVKFYEGQFLLAQKMKFGSSSEKSVYDQIPLDGIDDEVAMKGYENCEEPALEVVKEHYRKKRTRKDRLPEDLPVEEIVCELPASESTCPNCGTETEVLGNDYREELVIVPAKVIVRRYAARTYICRECVDSADRMVIIKAEMPNPVIKGSFASAEAVAYVAYQKFVMGVPLYRQEKEWERKGVMLSRQTLANWLVTVSENYLNSLVRELKKQLLKRDIAHADETTLQVLKEEGRDPRSKSYLWCYRTSGDAYDPIVVAEYKPDRKYRTPAEFLAEFKGYLHTDGYEAYHKLPKDIVVVGCWAHVRRKWDAALKAVRTADRNDTPELKGKRYCDKLFDIERDFALLDTEQRYKERLKTLKPVIDEFFDWASSIRTPAKSLLGKAISYMFSQKKYLLNILLDGRLELSNNRVERTIKPFVISRKNFLFANTPRGANAAANIFSLVETAKESGLDPFAYLTYVFKTAPNLDMNNPKNVKVLLPAEFKKQLS